MSDTGITSISTADASVSFREEPYAVVTDKRAYKEYSEAHPQLKGEMRVPWQTTNTHMKEHFLATGEPTLPGVEIRVRPVIGLRSKGKTDENL